jgi:hypothetical protein
VYVCLTGFHFTSLFVVSVHVAGLCGTTVACA